MKICAISNQNGLITNNKFKNTNKTFPVLVTKQENRNLPTYFGRDLISFRSNSLPKEISEKLPRGVSIYDVIQQSQSPENIVGQGANSIVYNLTCSDDYVLKVLNKDDPNGIKIGEFPQEVNLGQPVWQDKSNPRILILKKIEGSEHSIPNWSRTIWAPELYSPLEVTREQAELFAGKISLLASMPQKAYDKLAQDVKIVDKKGYKIDSINPNNLIVDAKKEEIHIIDFFKVPENEEEKYQNSCLDLVAVALDFTLFPEYFDKMTQEEKQQSIESVKSIKDKMYSACEKAGVSCDDEKFKKYIRTTSRWFPAHSVPNEKTGSVYFRYYDVRLEDFIDMIQNPQAWADKR